MARKVVEKINKIWGRKAFNLQIELMGWEDTIGSYGRPPQENINADLAKCELFIGMLWYEWGSSNIGRKYASGFEEEFRLAEEGNKAARRPAIHVLFKQVDEGRPGGAGPGYARIKEFKEEIRQKVLWHGFADEAEFRDKLETILSDYIIGLHQSEGRQEPQAATDEVKADGIPAQPPTSAAKAARVSPERLRTFIKSKGIAHRTGRSWVMTDNRARRVPIIVGSDTRKIVVPDFKSASRAGAYQNAIGRFVRSGDIDHIIPFVGDGLTDINGRFHPFETDPNELFRYAAKDEPAFHEIYQIVAN